jgi:hypothetical protein
MYLVVGHGVDLRHGGGEIGDCVKCIKRVLRRKGVYRAGAERLWLMLASEVTLKRGARLSAIHRLQPQANAAFSHDCLVRGLQLGVPSLSTLQSTPRRNNHQRSPPPRRSPSLLSSPDLRHVSPTLLIHSILSPRPSLSL